MNTFNYDSTIGIQSVALNVWDLQKQSAFYQDIIGLQQIQQTKTEVHLGVNGNVLLTLHQADDLNPRKEAGLFHTAFLLPTRADLGAMFRHLLAKKVRLQGVSDHIYSEAIYLADLEGNGIELYADRPMIEWEFDSRGRPVGRTLAMDGEAVLAAGAHIDITNYQMPATTIVGHVHLSVIDVAQTTQRYQQLLPLEDKMTLPIVSFIAGGAYHHHFAFNNWANVTAPKRDGEVGLRHINVAISDKSAFEQIASADVGHTLVQTNSDHLSVTDTQNGIVMNVYLAQATDMAA